MREEKQKKNPREIKGWAIIYKKTGEICELPHEYSDGMLIYSYDIFIDKKSAEVERNKSILSKVVPVLIKIID